jgi:hypothetical protein
MPAKRTNAGWLLSAMLVAACSGTPSSLSRLDSGGLTVVTLSDAVLLARPVPTLAAGARDYAYIGPVEINRMGNRRHYFWVGLASTIDRARTGLEPANPVALVLVADDAHMVFSLSEWTVAFDVPPYASTTPVYAALAAPASLDQIRRIARASAVEVRIIDDSGTTARYRHWRGAWADWAAFPGAG